MTDPRRRTPRTDVVLDDPALALAVQRLGRARVKRAVVEVLDRCRSGDVAPEDVVGTIVSSLPRQSTSQRQVVNATGVVVHTNLGRAPLSDAARQAVLLAGGVTDVELDLATGQRGPRGAGALMALAAAVPGRRGRARREQRRSSVVVGHLRARTRPHGRGRPWRAGRDRRRLPDPGAARVGGRPAARGGNHQPGPPRRLRPRRRRLHGLRAQGAPVQLPHRGVHLGGLGQ